MNAMWIGLAALLFCITFGAGYLLKRYFVERRMEGATRKANEIIEEADKKAQSRRKEVELEAKDLLYRTRTDFEKETKERRQELMALEKRLAQREDNLDRKVDILEGKERNVKERETSIISREKTVEAKEQEYLVLLDQEKVLLQRISGLNAEAAKNLLLEKMENGMQKEVQLMARRIEEEAREKAEEKAKEIVTIAIQKCAAEHVAESAVSVVALPSDAMKGRIIGREGRNIRALEIATGVDIIIDDTPEAVTLSAFDPIRREIARLTLERLIADGRIHPGRIEEIVAKVKKDMDRTIKEEGEKAALDAGVHGLHAEEIKLLGRLKYRTSYGQNVLQHAKEVAYLMGVMAGELGEDFAIARRVGLLHDIGKAVDHEVEGTHASIGAELVKKYGEPDVVVNAVGAHHQEVEATSILAVLVEAADAISATRPGARRETLESYVKRLEKLESIADSFEGVDKSYAIQAGREIRVIVKPDKLNDSDSTSLAKEIAGKIEAELEYPGQIKVNVIRETRAIEYAR